MEMILNTPNHLDQNIFTSLKDEGWEEHVEITANM